MEPRHISPDLQVLVMSGALTLEQALRITQEAHVANAPRQAGRRAATLDNIHRVLRGLDATLADFTGFKKIGGKELGAESGAYSHHGLHVPPKHI